MLIRKLLFSSLCILSATAFATDYAVTSTDDSGPGTLRDALESIGTGDTITFDSSLTGTIVLASALPAITIDTVITGPTSGSVTIDGSSLYQIFEVNSYTSISNLTLTNNDTSTLGSAILIDDSATLTLDTVSIPHCASSCQAPVYLQENATLFSNNMTFSSPGGSGVDVLFADGSGGAFGCDSSVQPEVWIDSSGTATLYKEGEGTMQLHTASSADISLVADEGTLLFSDEVIEPVIALPNGLLQGTPTSYYVANMGVVETGESFGVITDTTDYYQDSDGTLNVKIDASGNTDQVQAPGVGYLGGDLIIQLQPGTYTASTTYALLACDSGFSSEFDHVYFDIPGEGLQELSNASLTYGTDAVTLEITSTFVVDAPLANTKSHHSKLHHFTSPVCKLFAWMMEHKKRPHENVNHLLRSYQQHVLKEIQKEAHKKHPHH